MGEGFFRDGAIVYAIGNVVGFPCAAEVRCQFDVDDDVLGLDAFIVIDADDATGQEVANNNFCLLYTSRCV